MSQYHSRDVPLRVAGEQPTIDSRVFREDTSLGHVSIYVCV